MGSGIESKPNAKMSVDKKRVIWGFAASVAMGVTGVMMTNWNNPAIGNCAGVTDGRIEVLPSYGVTDDMCNRAYDVYHDGETTNDDQVSEIGGEPFGIVDDLLTGGALIGGLGTIGYLALAGRRDPVNPNVTPWIKPQIQ